MNRERRKQLTAREWKQLTSKRGVAVRRIPPEKPHSPGPIGPGAPGPGEGKRSYNTSRTDRAGGGTLPIGPGEWGGGVGG